MIGCGRADLARKNAFVALLLACALGVQVLLTGMALAGAAAPSGEAAFWQSCATTSSPTTGQDPLAPGGHKHGLCCILHTGFAGPGAPPAGVGDRLKPPADVKLAASPERWVALRPAPELEPLAPRGPPTFQI